MARESVDGLLQHAVNTTVVMMQEKKTTSHKSKHLIKRGTKRKKKEAQLIVRSFAWNNILQISYWENYRQACPFQRKGARPDRDEDPHGQKKRRKPTHRRISSRVGDGEKKVAAGSNRDWDKGKVACDGAWKSRTENLKCKPKKKKKKQKSQLRICKPQMWKKRLAQCFNSCGCCCFWNFFLCFFTPAAAHLLFGVVHVAIEQQSFVQPRQRLRQILIRTESWLSALRGD